MNVNLPDIAFHLRHDDGRVSRLQRGHIFGRIVYRNVARNLHLYGDGLRSLRMWIGVASRFTANDQRGWRNRDHHRQGPEQRVFPARHSDLLWIYRYKVTRNLARSEEHTSE